jgi:hypothetical protein
MSKPSKAGFLLQAQAVTDMVLQRLFIPQNDWPIFLLLQYGR